MFQKNINILPYYVSLFFMTGKILNEIKLIEPEQKHKLKIILGNRLIVFSLSF